MRSYVPLWVKSHFSFHEGASTPEELVEAAHAHGLPALALTDRDGVFGVVRAHVRARELGLPLLLGAQASVVTTAPSPATPQALAAAEPLLLLATSRAGWAALCRLLSAGRRRCAKGHALVDVAEVCGHAQELIAIAPTPTHLPALRDAFDDRLYALVTRHLASHDGERERRLREAARKVEVPLVGGSEVLYHHPSRRSLQDVLTCIRHGIPLAKAGTLLRGNAEHELATPHAIFERFADAPEILRRTHEIAERCSFSLAQLRYVYPAEHVPSGSTTGDWLRTLTLQGAASRYPSGVPDDVLAQIDRELAIIHDLDYGGYFLTMWEIVQFCRREGILCQGRGSAANSIVCYCLGITAVDPVRMDLLFERFISRERAEPPDIDLDIEHQRREEVIQWVYTRYGRRRAAMVAIAVRYRVRSALRDVGKALGLAPDAIDRLARSVSGWDDDLGHDPLSRIGLDPSAELHRHLLRLVAEIVDFPRHLSIHPGGFILGHEPVDEMVPIEPGAMEDRTVIQWDKYDVEDLGLFKVDLLGLGALSHVRRAFELLRMHDGVELDMARVPADDPRTYAMIARGDTLGVFQIESRAQMAMLPRLRPRGFYDLVIEVAIVRPGPIQGDMVHPYLRRRQGLERVEFPHPMLERVLAKTLGVPIFQEQVMKLAVLVADYTPGEADKLRRDMAAWRSSGKIEQHRERLVSRMIANGIRADFAERVFSQIRGFGEYGFPESHAASFALIAYVTAWLRANHPAVFTCALLDAQPMGFYAPSTIVDDAKRRGVEVRPIDVRYSAWSCTLERDVPRAPLALRMGLRWVKGLGEAQRAALERAPPPYRDLDDFVRRTGLDRRSLLALAEAGALEPLASSSTPTTHDHGASRLARRDTLWAVRGAKIRSHDTLRQIDGAHLAEDADASFAPLTPHEGIAWDYRASLHSTSGHPMAALRGQLQREGLPDAAGIAALGDGRRVRYVGLVICRQRPQTASGVTFYTLEDEAGFVNLVVWSTIFDRDPVLARTAGLLGVTGRIQRTDGVVHLVADALWDPRLRSPAGVRSHDFR
jgi:error-prone DNA polymerase